MSPLMSARAIRCWPYSPPCFWFSWYPLGASCGRASDMAMHPVTPRWLGLLFLGALLVVLILLPLLVNNYWLRIATGALMWAGLACSWNMLGGYAGYINFGHSAFFGLGAYVTALLMADPFALPFLVTVPAGIAVTAVCAVVIGAPTLRLR